MEKAKLDGAIKVSDKEAIEMAYHLKMYDGLFVGPSAALNLVGAVKLARILGKGQKIVTIICDGGERNRSKFFNDEFLREKDIYPRLYDRGDLSFIEPITPNSFCESQISKGL